MLRRLAVFAFLSLLAQQAAAERPVEGARGVPLFATPRYVEAQRPLRFALAEGRWDIARRELERLIPRYPNAPDLRFARAVVAAFLGEGDEAAEALAEAIDLGYPRAEAEAALARPPFAALPDRTALERAVNRPAPQLPPPHEPKPALVKDGFAPVEPENSVWRPEEGVIRVSHVFPPRLKYLPVARDMTGRAWKRLQRLVSRGFAAGNAGDLYDNRDGGHSSLLRRAPNQLTHTRYGDAAKRNAAHYGFNYQILFDAPTFGNSSTAFIGAHWRSQGRGAMTRPGAPQAMARWYANNHIYVFPEHTDHDPPPEGRGDLFPANTPYMLISQGSSGSDRPFLRAVQVILAGLRPEVKRELIARRMLAPAVQQVFRSAMAAKLGPEGYLSPEAHRLVWDGAEIDLDAMIDAAQALRLDALPPLARLAVVEEPPRRGALAADGEALFTTPHAIARLWRAAAGTRRYVLDAGGSEDPNGRPLTFAWRVLRGDPAKIDIHPLDPAGQRAEIVIRWHDPGAGAKLPGGRIDIGLFAYNGATWSAPAFFSLSLPLHQRRVYDETMRPLSISDPGEGYADPLLWPRRRWRDDFHYAADGALLGWTRTYPDGKTAHFTPGGLKVTEEDAEGRPLRAEGVAYAADGAGWQSVLKERLTGRRYTFRYASPQDRRGVPVATR